jgi:hypothetical protein
MHTANGLMKVIGSEEHNDFNIFREKVNDALKTSKSKLSSSELNAVLNAVTWYDAGAEKVLRDVVKLTGASWSICWNISVVKRTSYPITDIMQPGKKGNTWNTSRRAICGTQKMCR